MSDLDYRPRISIEITEEQRQGLADINLPHGWQRALFSAVVDDILYLHSTFGIEAIAVIVGRIRRASEVLPALASATRSCEKITQGEKDNG